MNHNYIHIHNELHEEYNEFHYLDKNNHNNSCYYNLNDRVAPLAHELIDSVLCILTKKTPQVPPKFDLPPRNVYPFLVLF